MVASASGLYSSYQPTSAHHHSHPHLNANTAHTAPALYGDSFALLPPPGQPRYANESFEQNYIFAPSASLDAIALSAGAHPQSSSAHSPSQGRNPLGLDWLSPPPGEHAFENGTLGHSSSASHPGQTPPAGEQPAPSTPGKADTGTAAPASAGGGKAQKARKEVSSVVIACKQW